LLRLGGFDLGLIGEEAEIGIAHGARMREILACRSSFDLMTMMESAKLQ
jgi:hypothetical protein